ncbi:MAG: nascent polypeptide-associated complex protein [Promethearchaeota archaeon]
MQQQGIEMDQIDATRVIIESHDKTLVIDQPEVILMKQMGQEMYQIIGDAEEYPSGEFTIEDREESESIEPTEGNIFKPVITENDIMLVAAQAKVGKEEANAALIDSDGDIAKAIINLKNKP